MREEYERLRNLMMSKALVVPAHFMEPASPSFAAELQHFETRVDRMRREANDAVNYMATAMAMACYQDRRSAVDRLADLVRPGAPSPPRLPWRVVP